MLISRGADINAVDSTNACVLLWAVDRNRLWLVRLLLEHGARPDVADNKGRTPLSLAMQRGYHNVARELIKAGASTEGIDVSKLPAW